MTSAAPPPYYRLPGPAGALQEALRRGGPAPELQVGTLWAPTAPSIRNF